jgi:hypothetical protein
MESWRKKTTMPCFILRLPLPHEPCRPPPVCGDVSHQKPIHCPTTIPGENMEIEKLYIIRREGEVMGLDGASLQSPSIPSPVVFNLDQPERTPSSKRSLTRRRARSGFQKLVISCRSGELRSV